MNILDNEVLDTFVWESRLRYMVAQHARNNCEILHKSYFTVLVTKILDNEILGRKRLYMAAQNARNNG